MTMKHGIDTRPKTAASGVPPLAERASADSLFVHLHVHSSFSLREGAMSIAKLITFAGADPQPALAITDTNNLFGALEFTQKVS